MARKRTPAVKKLSEFELGYKTALVETYHEFRRETGKGIHIDNTKPGIAVLEGMATILGPGASVHDLYVGNNRRVLVVSPERKVELWEEVKPRLLFTDEVNVDVYKARIEKGARR